MVWYMCDCLSLVLLFSNSICLRTQRNGSRRPRMDLRDNFRIFGHGATGNTAQPKCYIFFSYKIMLDLYILIKIAYFYYFF